MGRFCLCRCARFVVVWHRVHCLAHRADGLLRRPANLMPSTSVDRHTAPQAAVPRAEVRPPLPCSRQRRLRHLTALRRVRVSQAAPSAAVTSIGSILDQAADERSRDDVISAALAALDGVPPSYRHVSLRADRVTSSITSVTTTAVLSEGMTARPSGISGQSGAGANGASDLVHHSDAASAHHRRGVSGVLPPAVAHGVLGSSEVVLPGVAPYVPGVHSAPLTAVPTSVGPHASLRRGASGDSADRHRDDDDDDGAVDDGAVDDGAVDDGAIDGGGARGVPTTSAVAGSSWTSTQLVASVSSEAVAATTHARRSDAGTDTEADAAAFDDAGDDDDDGRGLDVVPLAPPRRRRSIVETTTYETNAQGVVTGVVVERVEEREDEEEFLLRDGTDLPPPMSPDGGGDDAVAVAMGAALSSVLPAGMAVVSSTTEVQVLESEEVSYSRVSTGRASSRSRSRRHSETRYVKGPVDVDGSDGHVGAAPALYGGAASYHGGVGDGGSRDGLGDRDSHGDPADRDTSHGGGSRGGSGGASGVGDGSDMDGGVGSGHGGSATSDGGGFVGGAASTYGGITVGSDGVGDLEHEERRLYDDSDDGDVW